MENRLFNCRIMLSYWRLLIPHNFRPPEIIFSLKTSLGISVVCNANVVAFSFFTKKGTLGLAIVLMYQGDYSRFQFTKQIKHIFLYGSGSQTRGCFPRGCVKPSAKKE